MLLLKYVVYVHFSSRINVTKYTLLLQQFCVAYATWCILWSVTGPPTAPVKLLSGQQVRAWLVVLGSFRCKESVEVYEREEGIPAK